MLVVGLDFGTLSVRAQVVDTENGSVHASATELYQHGVIEGQLPYGNVELPPQWALQHPQDWLDSMIAVVRKVAKEVDVSLIGGIGIDSTGCTVLPVKSDGTPLVFLGNKNLKPHAWPKLWKHNSAQAEANLLTRVALERREMWINRCGGAVSPAFMLAKALQLLKEDPTIYREADLIVEESDWLVWQLTGNFQRNSFGAEYLAYISKVDGPPSREYLQSVDPGLADFYLSKGAGTIASPGTSAGYLRPYWAQRLGLPLGISVSVPTIDGPAGAIGGGITADGVMYMMMGTSTVHFLLSEREAVVPGIAGVARDAIFPGQFLYGVPQVAVGDAFNWFTEQVNQSHEYLTEKAQKLSPGANGLVALDWFNGGRKPEVVGDLSGAVIGYTLQTTPEDVYRSLIESTAFGTRYVVDTFCDAGIPVYGLRAGGGLTSNSMLLQIYSDVTGFEIEVSAVQNSSVFGAALLGAVASGVYDSVMAASDAMVPDPIFTIKPIAKNKHVYDALYTQYLSLIKIFGHGESPLLKLREINRKSLRQ
tara:strand:- start:9646 stop:11250 length:1605 start_codon:yes stop_codon:yes gene_type:complete